MSCDVGEVTEKLENEQRMSTIYRNKISLKLGYRAINSRKYMRCARTFYLKGLVVFTYVVYFHSLGGTSLVLAQRRGLHEQSSFSKLQSLHLRHSSFPNPSVALPTSQLILQPFCCFTYIIAHSPILLSLLLHHRLFTYLTWRATMVLCKQSNLPCTIGLGGGGRQLRSGVFMFTAGSDSHLANFV